MTWGMVGTILLTLLKILGILVLILLLLVVLVLFVPVRYRVRAVFEEDCRVCGRIYWLGFLVQAPFQWQDGQGKWKLRILGIPVYKGGEDVTVPAGKTMERQDTASRGMKPPAEEEGSVDRQEQTTGVQNTASRREPDGNPAAGAGRIAEKTHNSIKTRNKPPQSEQNNKEHKKRSLIGRIAHRIRNWYRKICRLIRSLKKRIRSVWDLLEILRSDPAKRFICIARDNMLHLWKQLRPRKIRGDIRFGTGDPCSTGQALGMIALFYGWIGRGVRITPDFEEACFEGRLEVRGRIAVFTLVVFVIRLMTNKDFRRLQREWEQWKEDF